MMAHQSRNRKLVFGLMFAMIGGRLLVFALGIVGVIAWSPPISASILSWVIPVVMPLAMITIMLLVGRPAMHRRMAGGSEDVPLSEVLQKRFAFGEITKDQYEGMKEILSRDEPARTSQSLQNTLQHREGTAARVAIVTDDGETISAHFGIAEHYVVYEIQAGAVKGKETRPKMAHQPGMVGNQGHASMHEKMLTNVRDCEALIAGGMGRPMYEAIKGLGIKPFLTELVNVDDAVGAYIQGTLDDHVEKLH